MKIKKFLFVFLIMIFMFSIIPQAKPNREIPVATTFKQGIYDISQYSQYFGRIKLATPDKPVTIIILNSKGMQKAFAILNSSESELSGSSAQKGDTLVVVGPGEISVSKAK